jgi:hypothetical protein
MPIDKEGNQYPYTPEGIAAAKAADQNAGMPVSDGAMRSVQEYAGGGKTGYSQIGVYHQGGSVSQPHAKSAYERNNPSKEEKDKEKARLLKKEEDKRAAKLKNKNKRQEEKAKKKDKKKAEKKAILDDPTTGRFGVKLTKHQQERRKRWAKKKADKQAARLKKQEEKANAKDLKKKEKAKASAKKKSRKSDYLESLRAKDPSTLSRFEKNKLGIR